MQPPGYVPAHIRLSSVGDVPQEVWAGGVDGNAFQHKHGLWYAWFSVGWLHWRFHEHYR